MRQITTLPGGCHYFGSELEARAELARQQGEGVTEFDTRIIQRDFRKVTLNCHSAQASDGQHDPECRNFKEFWMLVLAGMGADPFSPNF
jgi:hypothetical protein